MKQSSLLRSFLAPTAPRDMLSGLNGSGYLRQSFPDFIPEVFKNEFREFLGWIAGMG